MVELTTMAVGVEAEEVTIPEAAVRAATIAELTGPKGVAVLTQLRTMEMEAEETDVHRWRS